MSSPVSTPAGNASDKYTVERITWVHTWVPGKLFSFRLTRSPGFRFKAGQFARLGVVKHRGTDQETIAWRAYSVVSSPYDDHLEFFSIVVPEGEFTSELEHLTIGDPVLVDKTAFGFLTIERFEGGKHLWLLSSGTGLAPFMAVLNDLRTWDEYEKIILVHSVRTPDELAYREQIEAFAEHEVYGEYFSEQPDKLVYLPVITRSKDAAPLHQRITALIESGELEKAAGTPLTLADSRIMLCGNPQMVDDLRAVLGARGFTSARRSSPGQIAVENYW